MKFHHLIKSPRLGYPVSQKIMNNMPTINFMMAVLCKFLKENYKRTDIKLFCRGSSGAILAGLTANYLIKAGYNVCIEHVKKEGETSHGGDYVQKISRNYIIVIIDDFISTGSTIRNIYNAMLENNSPKIQIDIVCVSDTVVKSSIDSLPIKHVICE
jgi:orotate phosphoribosyltransferase-like protein